LNTYLPDVATVELAAGPSAVRLVARTDRKGVPMKIGVIHRISDPQRAQERGQAFFEPHEGVQLLQFVPSEDFSTATCIWESDSIDTVSAWVDETLGDTSQQTWFAIATEQAVGLPERATATTA
jgi:hypothetical protein